MSSPIVVLGGTANPDLTQQICQHLKIAPGNLSVGTFSDGESRVCINENVRGAEVYIVQSTCSPGNHNLVEGLLIVDACRRASAKSITFVSPYFGYARQERKDSPRSPISAKLVARLFEASGVDRMLTLELHNSAIQGFFDCPVDHLFAKGVFAQYFRDTASPEVVVSPDAGGVERSRAFAKLCNSSLAIIDKRRSAHESAVMHIIGSVEGKSCLILDDIVDTGGSLVNASKALHEAGAKSIKAAITHPVLSGPALGRIEDSPLDELVVTNSIPLSPEARQSAKIKVTSVAPLIAEAVRRIHECRSVSDLFA